MSRLKLLFGVHNHQPVGNFDHVFEDVFHKCSVVEMGTHTALMANENLYHHLYTFKLFDEPLTVDEKR